MMKIGTCDYLWSPALYSKP